MKTSNTKHKANGSKTQLKPPSNKLTLLQKMLWYHARMLALSMSLVVSPLTAVFWQQLMARTILTIIAEQGFPISPGLNATIQSLSSVFAATKCLADDTAVNPLALADNYIFLKRPTSHFPWTTRWLSIPVRLISLGLVTSSFSLMPIIALSEHIANDPHTIQRRTLNTTIFTGALIYGIDYYWTFHKEPLECLLNSSISLFSYAFKNIKFGISNAEKLLEILLTTTLRSGMLALTNAFIVFEASRYIFETNPRHPAVKTFASTVALSTFLYSFLIRLQKKKAKYFDKTFPLLKTDHITTSLNSLLFKNCLPSFIRGAMMGIFTLDLLRNHTQNHWILATVGYTTFALLFGQSLSISYKMAKLEIALTQQVLANSNLYDGTPLPISVSKTRFDNGSNDLTSTSSEMVSEHSTSSFFSNERSSLTSSASTYSLSDEINASRIDRSQLFDELANMPHFQPSLPTRITFYAISIAAQLIQCICAYFILTMVNHVFGLRLNPIGIAALSILLNAVDFKEDVSNNTEQMCYSQTNRNVAYAIESQKVSDAKQHMFFKPLNYIKNRTKAWFVSPVSYSIDEMTAARPMR